MSEEALIEATDRYGGHPPHWLVGCHGDCEAMGFFPTQDRTKWPADARPIGVPAEGDVEDDGWRFVICPDCNGTGRVGALRVVSRVPLWIWRGLRFVWSYGVLNPTEHPDGLVERVKLAWRCCFHLRGLRR